MDKGGRRLSAPDPLEGCLGSRGSVPRLRRGAAGWKAPGPCEGCFGLALRVPLPPAAYLPASARLLRALRLLLSSKERTAKYLAPSGTPVTVKVTR